MNLYEKIKSEPPNPLDEEARPYIIRWIPRIMLEIESACMKLRGGTHSHQLNGFMFFHSDCDGEYAALITKSLDDYFWELYCRWFHGGDFSKRTYDGICGDYKLAQSQGQRLFYYGLECNFSNPDIIDKIIVALQSKLIEEGFPEECFKISHIKYTYKWPTGMTGFWNPKLVNFIERTEHTIGLCITW